MHKYLVKKEKQIKKKPHHAAKPVLNLKRQNDNFTFYTVYIANLKIPIAMAMFR